MEAEHAFVRIEDVASGSGFCTSCNKVHDLEMGNRQDLYVAGIPCEDMSHLNQQRWKPGRDVSGGRTVCCWRAFLEHMRRFRPRIGILENVAGWMRKRKDSDDALTQMQQMRAELEQMLPGAPHWLRPH